MTERKMRGEGNPEADAHYRKGVEETVEKTTADERAKALRELSDEQEAADNEARKESGTHKPA